MDHKRIVCAACMDHKRIVCAACKYKDILFISARHFDKLMHNQIAAMGLTEEVTNNKDLVIQGFIDNKGEFLNRKEAAIVAKRANQIRKKHGSKYDLFSEDLY